MEYCPRQDMLALIKNCKNGDGKISEEIIWKMFTHLIIALNECHTRKEGKILHWDIKPSNVFFDEN